MALTAAELMVRVGADTSAAERGLQSMGSKVQNAGRAMTQTGLAMTAGITAPLLGIAAAALNSAADFEQSMNVLQQVSGASTETMDEMTQAALKLGAETSFSAGEAADAMLELAKAGMETDEVLASIGGVMDLAAAGGIALADAANITANALNAFSLEASEADRIANLLAGGANASSADISDLSDGLAQAGFAFANANQPIENLVASLALLTNVGLTGSDAGTALKNAFMRLMAPTKEARAVMSELNLEFYDASGQMKALPDMISMMNEAFADMTPQQRDAALSTLFLSDGMKAMIPLLDAGTEGFNDMVAAVSAEGQASAVAGARMKGLRGAIEYLKGSVDSFLIGAARPFLDTISEWIRMGADWLTSLGEMPPEMLNMALALAAVAAAAGPVLLVIGAITSALTPLNLIILAVTAAVSALAFAWASDFMGIQGAAQSAWDTVSGFFAEVVAAPATTTALSTISTFFSDIATQAATMATAVQTAFANTTFPTLADLWADFSEGDFAALAEKITSTAYELMVNLDAELGISAQANGLAQVLVDAVNGVAGAVAAVDWSVKATEVALHMTGLRDTVYSSLTTAISAVPWTTIGTSIQSKIDELTAVVSGFTLDIDWKAFLTSIIVTPIKLAVAGLTWVFSGDDFIKLQEAVGQAIDDLGWTNIAASLADLGIAIKNQLKLLVWDIAADFGVDLDTVIPDFTDAATQWKNKFLQDLIVNSPAYSTVATVWGKLLANDLEATPIDFAAAALKIANGVVAAVDAIPWHTMAVDTSGLVTQVGLELGQADWSFAGHAAADAVKASFTLAFGLAFLGDMNTLANRFVTGLIGKITGGFAIAVAQTSWVVPALALISGLASALQTAWATFWTDLGFEVSGFSVGLPKLDWATYIPDIKWDDLVAGIKWPDFIAEISWATFIPIKLAWADFIPTVLSWDTFLDVLEWGNFINTLLWSLFIPFLLWTTFVPSLSWPAFISDVNWSSYIESLTWSTFIPVLTWAGMIPALTWGAFIPSINWGDFISVFSGGEAEAEASGTPYAKGGMTWVGERGPELINLPRGTRVWNNTDSMAMAGGGGVHIAAVHIHNDMDVEVLAATIARRISQGGRR